jgi:hypothetical protein
VALPFWFSRRTGADVTNAALVEQWEAQERERQLRFQRNWAYYTGRGTPRTLKIADGQEFDDNVRTNWARLFVDKGVSFLFGAGLTVEVGADEERDEATEKVIEDIWQANDKDILLHILGTNGAVCGHAFVKLAQKPGQVEPRIILLDPANVAVFWHPDDYERVLGYRLQWTGIDPLTGRAITRRQDIAPNADPPTFWEITDYISRGTGARWEQIGSERWPFEFAPILSCQNLPAPNEYWGTEDLDELLIDTMQTHNYLASNITRIIRFYAHPLTYVTGARASNIDRSPGGVFVLPAEAKMQNLEMQSDLSSSIELVKMVQAWLHAQACVPEVATGRTEDLGALSGTALQVMYQPLVERTATKRRLYGRLIEDISRACLAMMGQPSDIDLRINWPTALPENESETLEASEAKLRVGVSKATVLQELGYDPEEQAEARKQEAEEDAEVGEEMLRRFDRGQVGGRTPEETPEE